MNGKLTALCIVTYVALFGLPRGLLAAEASFPETFNSGDVRFEKIGEGTFKWYFFTVYEGAYYEGEPSATPDGNMLRPRHLELFYHREIPAEKIRKGGDAILKRNVTDATFQRLEPALREINAAYEDVAKGDRYELTFLPGEGTTLRFNGREVARIPGEEFAQAYFQIWLGAAPLDEGFRDALLGR